MATLKGGDYPARDNWGRERTAYAVNCTGPFDLGGHGHGLVYMSDAEYSVQMARPDSTWRCPICGYDADWLDDNYEEVIGLDKIEVVRGDLRELLKAARDLMGTLGSRDGYFPTAGATKTYALRDALEAFNMVEVN